jgi:hypothetical protein
MGLFRERPGHKSSGYIGRTLVQKLCIGYLMDAEGVQFNRHQVELDKGDYIFYEPGFDPVYKPNDSERQRLQAMEDTQYEIKRMVALATYFEQPIITHFHGTPGILIVNHTTSVAEAQDFLKRRFDDAEEAAREFKQTASGQAPPIEKPKSMASPKTTARVLATWERCTLVEAGR